MKTYLLDTNVFLWWQQDSVRLSKKIRSILSNPDNLIYVSICSAWEVATKLQKHTDFVISVPVEKLFLDSDFLLLPIELSHIEQLQTLEKLHLDPFGRMVIAQALVLGATLITSDEKICQYSLKTLRV